MRKILSPSVLAADFKILGDEIKRTYAAGAQFLHFDVMDGIFVPSISFGMPVLKSIQGLTPQVMDVHLMIARPIRYVQAFYEAGADFLTVHLEACKDIKSVSEKIHQFGMSFGVSIKPGTDVKELLPVIDSADMFLIMCVEPGFGGQEFLPQSLEKVRALKKLLKERDSLAFIEVDGGINPKNVREVLNAGADVIVAGSSVFTGCIENNVKRFMEIFQEYE